MRPKPRHLSLSMALLVVWALLLTGAPGFAADEAPAQAGAAQSHPDHDDPLLIDEAPATKSSARSSARRWRQSRIYYYDTIPTKWDWSLTKAVSKWNASGGGVKLVRTVYRSKAKVRISYGDIGQAAGKATIGSTSGAYVRLSSRYASVSSADAWRRIEVMAVFAHELGHVLGFGHTTATCSLMRAVLDVGCHLPPTSPPGYHTCRTIDSALVRSFIKLYGGRARYPSSTWCLIDPLPPSLTGVSFTGGVNSPVTVRWSRPGTVPTGSKVEIRLWPGDECTSPPAWGETALVAPTALQWQDTGARTKETHCFRARLVNRFGAGRTAVLRPMARWIAPPAAPVIDTPEWDPAVAAFIFTESHPEGMYLRAQWDVTDPTRCPEVYDPESQGVLHLSGEDGAHSLQLPAGPVCVSFFTWDAATDSYSPATQERFPGA